MFDVGIDVDGVLHAFHQSFRHYVVINKIRTEEQCSHPVDRFNFYREWGISDDEFPEICNAGVDAGVIFDYGDPMEADASASLYRLRELGHRIHIITYRLFGTNGASKATTLRYLQRHDLIYDSIAFSKDKTVVPTDFFLEDQVANYDQLELAGCESYLINRPWNEMVDGDDRRRVSSISEFVDIIEKRTPNPLTTKRRRQS